MVVAGVAAAPHVCWRPGAAAQLRAAPAAETRSLCGQATKTEKMLVSPPAPPQPNGSSSAAALIVKRSYHRTLRLVLIGELQGRRTADGHWEVDAQSAQQFAVQGCLTPGDPVSA